MLIVLMHLSTITVSIIDFNGAKEKSEITIASGT